MRRRDSLKIHTVVEESSKQSTLCDPVTPRNNDDLNHEEDEPTIVVSSFSDDDDDDNDEPNSTNRHSVNNIAYVPHSTLSSGEASALQSIRLWISIAHDFSSREEGIHYDHSSKICALLNSLNENPGLSAYVTSFIDQQMLMYGLPLVERFSSFCSDVDGSYSIEKNSQMRKTQYIVHNEKILLSRTLNLLGCLELILRVATLPHSSLLRDYSKSNTLLLFIANFLSQECLEILEHYSYTSARKTKQKKSQASIKRFKETYEEMESPLMQWPVSVLNSLVCIILHFSRISALHELPQAVLRAMITFLARALQFRSMGYRKKKNLPSTMDQRLLQSFHEESINLLIELYGRFADLKLFIEETALDLVSLCIPSFSVKKKQMHHFPALVVLFLRLPSFSCEESSQELMKHLVSCFCDSEDAIKLVRHTVQCLKKKIYSLCLHLIKKCLLLTDITHPPELSKSFSTALSTERDRLCFLVRCFCQAANSFLYPTALFYVQQFFNLFARFALSTSQLGTDEILCDSIIKPLGLEDSEISHVVRQSSLILLGQMAQHIFHLHNDFDLVDYDQPILVSGTPPNDGSCGPEERRSNGNGPLSHKYRDLSFMDASDTKNEILSHTSISSSSCKKEDAIGCFIKQCTLPTLALFSLDSSFKQAVATETGYLHVFSPLLASYSEVPEASDCQHGLSSLDINYFAFLFHYDRKYCNRNVSTTSIPYATHSHRSSSASHIMKLSEPFWLVQNLKRRKLFLALLASWLLEILDASLSSNSMVDSKKDTPKSPFSTPTWISSKTCISLTSDITTTTFCPKAIIGLVAIEILLTSLHLCPDRSKVFDSLGVNRSVYSDEFYSLTDSNLARFWEKCILRVFNSLEITAVQTLLSVHIMHCSKISWSALVVLGDCCTQHPFLLIHPLYGLRIVQLLMKGFDYETSRCSLYILTFFGELWTSLKHYFPAPYAMSCALTALNQSKRIPYLNADDTFNVLSFLHGETLTELVDQLYQDLDRSFKVSIKQSRQKPKDFVKKRLASCLRVLEIILRLFLPGVTRMLTQTSAFLRLHCVRILKQVILDCSVDLSFLPCLTSKILRRLHDPEETHQCRFLAASVMNTFFFQRVLQIKETDSSSNKMDTECQTYVRFLVETLFVLGELHQDAFFNMLFFFKPLVSLNELWKDLQIKLSFIEDSCLGSKNKKKDITPAPLHGWIRQSTERHTDVITLNEISVYQTDFQNILGRHIDIRLTTLTQVVLYGLATQRYTLEQLDQLCEWLLSHFLSYFVQYNSQKNKSLFPVEDNLAVYYLRALRKVLELRPLNLSFVEFFLNYFQHPPETKDSILFLSELCHLIAVATWNWSTLSNFREGSSENPHATSIVSTALIKNYCLLEDLLLENLIPSTSRFLIAVAIQCLHVSVNYVTFHFSHIIEPYLADCLAYLLPFRFWIKQYHSLKDKDNIFLALIQYGITSLTRHRVEFTSIHVMVDYEKTELLRKQIIFLFEGLKRRIWILGVMSSLIDFQSDITHDMSSFLPFMKNRIHEQHQRNVDSHSTCDETLSQLTYYNHIIQEYRTLQMPRENKTLTDQASEFIFLENFAVIFQETGGKASTSTFVSSRIFHAIIQFLLENLKKTHDIFFRKLYYEFLHDIFTWILGFLQHFSQMVFFLFLDLYDSLPQLINPPHSTSQDILKVQILVLQCLGFFLQKHQKFITLPRFRQLMIHALQYFHAPRLQLTAIQILKALLTCFHETRKSAQPFMVFSEYFLVICRGYTLTKLNYQEWVYHIALPQAFSSTQFSLEFLEEYDLLRCTALESFSLLHKQGLLSPSTQLELSFALLFHSNENLRNHTMMYLNTWLEKHLVETFLFSRLGTLFYHGFTTMLISCYVSRSNPVEGVCSLCGLIDLSCKNVFHMSSFSVFYEKYLLHHPNAFERTLSICITLLQRGLESQYGAVLLAYIPAPLLCQCSTGLFLSKLVSTFSLTPREAFYFFIHFNFLEWISHLLINIPGATHDFAQSCLKLIASYVFSQLSLLSSELKYDNPHPFHLNLSRSNEPSSRKSNSSPSHLPLTSSIQNILLWKFQCEYNGIDPNEQFNMCSSCLNTLDEDNLEQHLARQLHSSRDYCSEVSALLLSILMGWSFLSLLQLGHSLKVFLSIHPKETLRSSTSLQTCRFSSTTASRCLNLKHFSVSPPSLKVPVLEEAFEKLKHLLSVRSPLTFVCETIKKILTDVTQSLHVLGWEDDREHLESCIPKPKNYRTKRLSNQSHRVVKRSA